MTPEKSARMAIMVSHLWHGLSELKTNRSTCYKARAIVEHDRALNQWINGEERNDTNSTLAAVRHNSSGPARE